MLAPEQRNIISTKRCIANQNSPSVGLLCLLDARQTKTLSHLVVLFCGKSDGVRGFGLYNCWFADRPWITGPSNLPVTPLHYTSRPVLVGSFPT